jgi:hypothetical protein
LLDDLAAALGAAGLVTRRNFRFGNWYDDTRGLSFHDDLAQRPAALRHTFRRQSARLARAARCGWPRFGMGRSGRRWMRTNGSMLRARSGQSSTRRSSAALLADAGALRLGLLSPDERPVPAQIWIVRHGTATLYKLAHDRACDALSPGTVLIMGMLERLFDDERITGLDLGAGDDPYQRLWAVTAPRALRAPRLRSADGPRRRGDSPSRGLARAQSWSWRPASRRAEAAGNPSRDLRRVGAGRVCFAARGALVLIRR